MTYDDWKRAGPESPNRDKLDDVEGEAERIVAEACRISQDWQLREGPLLSAREDRSGRYYTIDELSLRLTTTVLTGQINSYDVIDEIAGQLLGLAESLFRLNGLRATTRFERIA